MRHKTEQLLQTAQSHQQAGRLAEAEVAYRQVLARDPRNFDAFYQLGLIVRQTRRPGVALDLYRKAVAVYPDAVPLLCELAVTLQDGRRFSEATDIWRRITQLEPDNPEAHAQLGALLILLGNLPQGVESLQHAAKLDPMSSGLQSNLGSALAILSRFEEAVVAQRRAVELNPNAPEPHHNLAASLRQVGLLEESFEQFKEAIRLRPSYRAAGSGLLLNLQYRRHDRAEVLAEHRDWEKRITASVRRSSSHPNDRSCDRRLRIGYVSADFRLHSVGFFIEPLIAAHDANVAEIFCYSGAHQPDEVTARIERHAHVWRNVRGASDSDLVQMIRRDRIDILVDLAGHTGGERLLAFAARPAPIQVSYLGYPDTTGLSAMDYRITDLWADPPGDADCFYVEKLIRLNRTAWCYRPPDATLPIEPLPCLQTSRITFGCFNAMPKFSPEILDLWAQILKRLPASRLLLKTGGLQDTSAQNRLLAHFTDRGIDQSRVELQGHTPSLADHLKMYGCIDIALDSFPYHGTTTTCDALWMGVPVITLAGDRHVSRVGVSLLSAVGWSELIANAPEEYVQRAVALADDRNRLASMRRDLRQTMRESPLTNARSLAHQIESAFRTIWKEWCHRPRST